MANTKAAHDDPRDPSLETKVTFPKSWNRESFADIFSMLAMFSAGLIIITRNRLLSWPALVLGINGFVNAHPLRSKESPNGRSSIGIALSAVIVSFMPFFLVSNQPQSTPPAVP